MQLSAVETKCLCIFYNLDFQISFLGSGFDTQLVYFIRKLVILVILDREKGVSRAFVQCKSSIVKISSRTLSYFKAPLKKESVAQTDLLYTTTSYLPFSTPRCIPVTGPATRAANGLKSFVVWHTCCE